MTVCVFFFFFKQKTAYELRISDWSSDVCSSDLRVFITGGGTGIGEGLVTAFVRQGAKVTFVDIADEPSRALVERLTPGAAHPPRYEHCDLVDIAALRRVIADVETDSGGKIGRASCRDRGCQYV